MAQISVKYDVVAESGGGKSGDIALTFEEQIFDCGFAPTRVTAWMFHSSIGGVVVAEFTNDGKVHVSYSYETRVDVTSSWTGAFRFTDNGFMMKALSDVDRTTWHYIATKE